MLIMAYDGDNAGKLVGRAILADDQAGLSEVSGRIELGHEIVRDWVESHGGKIISGGGDEGSWQVPQEALEDIEILRQDYLYATNLTMTIGVGNSLSEAGKSLLVGKFRGKNMVVKYDHAVEQELEQAKDNVARGHASKEEQKLSDAYLKPSEGDETPPEERNMSYEKQDLNPPVIDKPDTSKTPPIEQGVDVDALVVHRDPNDAPNQEMDKDMNPSDKPLNDPSMEQQAESNNQNAASAHSREAMKTIAEAIEGEENGVQTEQDLMGDIDAEDLAIGNESQGNVSHPDSYNEEATPGDLGLQEENVQDGSPDLNEVLRDGLDSHAENMQREKVVDMISQALVGFKAQKHILERAQTQAAVLYNSCLSMLKAMIEMSKMLGLGQQQENPLEDTSLDPNMEGQAVEEQIEENPTIAESIDPEAAAQEEAMQEESAEPCPYCDEASAESCPYCNEDAEAALSEENCPYCAEGEDHEKHKDKPRPQPQAKKPAVPSEGAALPPKRVGQ